jgi:hypothetical protein
LVSISANFFLRDDKLAQYQGAASCLLSIVPMLTSWAVYLHCKIFSVVSWEKQKPRWPM